MISNEEIIDTVCGSMALEGLIVPDEIRNLARSCLEGTLEYDAAVDMLISRYSETADVRI